MSSRVKKKPQPASKPRIAPAAVTPTKNFGVEVTPTDDGYVQFTIHAGNVAVTAVWAKQDVRFIANHLLAACESGAGGVDTPPLEILRESGLIVASSTD